ncbi:hypothetical protein PtB15_4B752 [Puccinia triticina]|nr:hypothetical protein PtB15_4B752 [Puccinia triticina]
MRGQWPASSGSRPAGLPALWGQTPHCVATPATGAALGGLRVLLDDLGEIENTAGKAEGDVDRHANK